MLVSYRNQIIYLPSKCDWFLHDHSIGNGEVLSSTYYWLYIFYISEYIFKKKDYWRNNSHAVYSKFWFPPFRNTLKGTFDLKLSKYLLQWRQWYQILWVGCQKMYLKVIFKWEELDCFQLGIKIQRSNLLFLNLLITSVNFVFLLHE